MHFVISCQDKADGGLELRKANRDAHIAYLQNHKSQLVAAGPTLSDDGETMNGSVIIMAFAGRAAAQTFCDNDPYAKAGVFENVSITAWKKVHPADD
ncbi:MAG: YciI family protein [Rhodospirillaceae bacterium]|jgi:hypothetical protein|nr:YciI family protein [Rhodospirillaceae bacterium]MBT3910832.1 YciI family protein [Rhodospirillaceae bacterium]MBT5296893.1 YciI family protein [Rhodospirillaceae bacterium]MBT5513812.1 YciI family protein [Rhodospirillaceae bacterium]MBT6085544.1 YciI family protein [Rhodospirillaceae bacterium]